MSPQQMIKTLRASRPVDQSSVVPHNDLVKAINKVEAISSALEGAIDLVERDVIRVRRSEKDQLLEWLREANSALYG